MSEIKVRCVYMFVVENDDDEEYHYIGSTNDFKDRISRHLSRCFDINSSRYNLPCYKFIRKNKCQFTKDNFIVLEEVEFKKDLTEKENRRDIEMIEQKHMNEHRQLVGGNILNINNAFTTPEERKACRNAWEKTDKGKAYRKARAISFICECGGKCDQKHKSGHVRTDKHRLFFGLKILRDKCDCGALIHPDDKSKHIKRLKHIENLEK